MRHPRPEGLEETSAHMQHMAEASSSCIILDNSQKAKMQLESHFESTKLDAFPDIQHLLLWDEEFQLSESKSLCTILL